MRLRAPPRSEEELVQRARGLAGRPLSWLAQRLQRSMPAQPRRDKGWTGNLIEEALGATAGNRADHDFPQLAIELKTLPVDDQGRVKQSTYVCTAPHDRQGHVYEESWVCKKLSRVLFLPIVGTGPLGTRRLGAPLMWSPTEDDHARLRADWLELSEILHRGEVHLVDARMGKVLQLRPKGAGQGRGNVWVLDPQGEWVQTQPLGFYLRARFTGELLQRHFKLR